MVCERLVPKADGCCHSSLSPITMAATSAEVVRRDHAYGFSDVQSDGSPDHARDRVIWSRVRTCQSEIFGDFNRQVFVDFELHPVAAGSDNTRSRVNSAA